MYNWCLSHGKQIFPPFSIFKEKNCFETEKTRQKSKVRLWKYQDLFTDGTIDGIDYGKPNILPNKNVFQFLLLSCRLWHWCGLPGKSFPRNSLCNSCHWNAEGGGQRQPKWPWDCPHQRDQVYCHGRDGICKQDIPLYIKAACKM